jgi:hypothetical protein
MLFKCISCCRLGPEECWHFLGVQEWKPTSNARNTAMIKEAKRFAFELKALHRDLTALSGSTDSKKGT